ncbi:hypothetical protein GCM10009104_01760 [Marinobacterium maritimum]|uniref:Glycosyltransferase n=1 Tax=Marinobacterium maritimum TaxID=500162 RepID=A0ABP3T798_9GAMM
MKTTRIIIIAKEPRPGFAKTRLIPALGPLGASALADRLLRHTLAQALAADIGPVELCVAPEMEAEYWQPWRRQDPIELTQQVEGNLGVRMMSAAERGLQHGHPVMLIGTDCPALNAHQLRAMSTTLARHDACLCPVSDGGYALLGLHRAHADLFTDIPWSTSEVARLTRVRLAQLNWKWAESPALWDVDEPGDLMKLKTFYPEIVAERF